tara:strand:- start:8314 stop:8802 length:489 start_codon:yes stop_codon:yes gene_type:complete
MDIDEMGEFFVEFEDSKMVDQFFGKLSAKKTETNEHEQNIIVVRLKDACSVIGGVSGLHLHRNNVPGIECNKDGKVTIDMSTDWIKKFKITEEDFRNGTKKLLRTGPAQKILELSSNSFVRNSYFKERAVKFGKLWVVDAEAVQEYNGSRGQPHIALVKEES